MFLNVFVFTTLKLLETILNSICAGTFHQLHYLLAHRILSHHKNDKYTKTFNYIDLQCSSITIMIYISYHLVPLDLHLVQEIGQHQLTFCKGTCQNPLIYVYTAVCVHSLYQLEEENSRSYTSNIISIMLKIC